MKDSKLGDLVEIRRCPRCKGAKEVMGLGMRVVKCKVCNGIGHIKVESPCIIEDAKEKKIVRKSKKVKEDQRENADE